MSRPLLYSKSGSHFGIDRKAIYADKIIGLELANTIDYIFRMFFLNIESFSASYLESAIYQKHCPIKYRSKLELATHIFAIEFSVRVIILGWMGSWAMEKDMVRLWWFWALIWMVGF